MKEVIQIGLAGLGTVGGGTYAVLKRNAKDLQAATGSAPGGKDRRLPQS